jgi:hypothetical protein
VKAIASYPRLHCCAPLPSAKWSGDRRAAETVLLQSQRGFPARIRRLPDGQKFLVVEPVDPRTSITLITNWFDELKTRAAIRN